MSVMTGERVHDCGYDTMPYLFGMNGRTVVPEGQKHLFAVFPEKIVDAKDYRITLINTRLLREPCPLPVKTVDHLKFEAVIGAKGRFFVFWLLGCFVLFSWAGSSPGVWNVG